MHTCVQPLKDLSSSIRRSRILPKSARIRDNAWVVSPTAQSSHARHTFASKASLGKLSSFSTAASRDVFKRDTSSFMVVVERGVERSSRNDAA